MKPLTIFAKTVSPKIVDRVLNTLLELLQWTGQACLLNLKNKLSFVFLSCRMRV